METFMSEIGPDPFITRVSVMTPGWPPPVASGILILGVLQIGGPSARTRAGNRNCVPMHNNPPNMTVKIILLFIMMKSSFGLSGEKFDPYRISKSGNK
jgi:hypothetical protein